MVAKGAGWGEAGANWGFGEWQSLTLVYGMGDQWGPAVSHREINPALPDNLCGHGSVCVWLNHRSTAEGNSLVSQPCFSQIKCQSLQ